MQILRFLFIFSIAYCTFIYNSTNETNRNNSQEHDHQDTIRDPLNTYCDSETFKEFKYSVNPSSSMAGRTACNSEDSKKLEEKSQLYGSDESFSMYLDMLENEDKLIKFNMYIEQLSSRTIKIVELVRQLSSDQIFIKITWRVMKICTSYRKDPKKSSDLKNYIEDTINNGILVDKQLQAIKFEPYDQFKAWQRRFKRIRAHMNQLANFLVKFNIGKSDELIISNKIQSLTKECEEIWTKEDALCRKLTTRTNDDLRTIKIKAIRNNIARGLLEKSHELDKFCEKCTKNVYRWYHMCQSFNLINNSKLVRIFP